MDDADVTEQARQIAEDLFDEGCTIDEISRIGLELFNIAEDTKEPEHFDLETWEPEADH